MLKCILFLLSEYYFEVVEERIDEVRAKSASYGVEVLYERAGDSVLAEREMNLKETLVIADEPETVKRLLGGGWYVVVLYHEQNRKLSFPRVRYGVEDVFLLEYRSYEEAYKRLAGLPWDILETDRLMVRESTVEDVEEFYRIYKDPSITLYIEDLYKDREEERRYMKAYIDQVYGFYGYGLWTILLKETGQIIGRAGLSVREGYELPELGFVIDVAFQRQGYGYEVCRGILKYAKEELMFEEVQALVKEENLPSRGLLSKLGFWFDRNVIEADCGYELFVKKI